MGTKHPGGRPRKLGPLEERIVYNQHEKGMPVTEIAYKNGISVSTVHRIVRKLKAEMEK